MTLPKVSEKDVQASIVQMLTMRGALVMRINSGEMPGTYTDKYGRTKKRLTMFAAWYGPGQGRTTSGVSDVLAVYKGLFLAIEVKAPGKKNNTTANQDKYLSAVKSARGVAVVADCLDDVISILDWYDYRITLDPVDAHHVTTRLYAHDPLDT